MTLIDKYLSREILKFLCIVLTAVTGIYLIGDLLPKADDFMAQDIALSRMITYFILSIPLVVSELIPVCYLLAVLIVLGLMSKNNEIIALKSGGISIYYLLRPTLVIGFLLCICQFLLSETVVPATTSKANKIWLQEVKKKTLVASRQKDIWIKGNRSIYHITYYNPQKNTLSGISLNYFDDKFKLIKRIEAHKGVFENGQWILLDIMEQVLDKNLANYEIAFYDRKVVQMDFLPDDLKRAVKKSEEMNFLELYAYIKDIEAEGYDATTYRVDFQAKFAFPLVCVIMGIVSTGLAAKRRVREGFVICIGYGIGLAFLYWVTHSFCMSLGYGGVVPAIIAAWITNIIFFCLGLLNLLNAE